MHIKGFNFLVFDVNRAAAFAIQPGDESQQFRPA